jgi:ketosteroid isomerase-like protein
MSENLDLVRSIYADWERGDFTRGDWADPEIERVLADGPEPEYWTGLTEMATAVRGELKTIEHFVVETDEFRMPDDERALALVRYGWRGRVSGVEIGEVHSGGAYLFHARDGKVTRLVQYFERDRALADLGVED